MDAWLDGWLDERLAGPPSECSSATSVGRVVPVQGGTQFYDAVRPYRRIYLLNTGRVQLLNDAKAVVERLSRALSSARSASWRVANATRLKRLFRRQ